MQALSEENTQSVTACIREGGTFTYECIVRDVTGIGLTVWSGESFKCMGSSNMITLTHSLYTNSEQSRPIVCGNFSAMVVGANGSDYISSLTFVGSAELDGTVINCALSGVILVKSITTKIGGKF